MKLIERTNFEIQWLLIPLLVVLILLFALLMTITSTSHAKSLFDFSLSSLLGTSAALVFVAILSHIDLRNGLEGTNITYAEYFYILTYVAIAFVTFNAYAFSEPKFKNVKLLHFQDNLISKISYWPMLLSAVVMVTYFYFY